MKKTICILLVFAMLALCFVSCGDDKPAESKPAESQPATSADTGTSADTSEPVSEETSQADIWKNENGDYMIIGEVKNFGGKEFSILVRGAKSGGTYQSDDFTTGSELYGEVLDTAVVERNHFVEDTYGVTLVIHKEDEMNSLINADLAEGGNYDLVMPTLPTLATLAGDGNLLDLRTFDDIHLEAPWYDQNANETFSMNHQTFFTTGDITILNKVCTVGMLFGKDLLALHPDLEDPYVLVKEHRWTYDKMKEMAKAVTADTDGEAGMSIKDTWGFLTSYGDAVNLYGAAGQHICEKDNNDYPYFYLGQSETAQTILLQILKDMADRGTWCVYAQDFPADIWVTSLDAIEEGRILFRPSAFSAMTKLRKRGVNFGVIPLPLWNEDQDNYYSYCGTGQTAGVGILRSCNDPEYSAYMLEAISAASKNYVTRAYVDVTIKVKDAPDDVESLEMIELIFDNILYDIGDVNNFGGINQLISGLVSAGSSDLASMLDANQDIIEDKIDSLIEAYEALS